MFDCTDAQGKIIEEFIEYDYEKLGKVGHGLSSGAIEKRGINRRTFVNNIDELVSNNFLYLIRSEKHNGPRKKSKQPRAEWKYYVVSHLGVLAYIKWATKNYKELSITKKFFPLITTHQRELNKLYGDLIIHLLEKTVDQINVKPEGQIITPDKKRKIPLSKLILTMNLPIQDLEIIFTDFIGEPKRDEIKYLGGLDHDFDYSKNKIIDQAVTDNFTFAFYFNLINLGKNASELVNLFFKLNFPLIVKENKIYEKDMDVLTRNLKKFQVKLEKNSKLITSLVNRDQNLNKLFKEKLQYLNSQLNQAKIIKHLQQNLK